MILKEGVQLTGRILIVEDEKQLARLLELELNHEGYDAVVEYNGKTGLSRFREEKDSFDLILLDILLPELDGIEVCKEIREFSQ
ncbi:MAG: response regulator, partial [Halanaerobiaceae bacterium]